jgi:hypothetical protein
VRKPMIMTMLAAATAFALGGGALTLATADEASAAALDTAAPAADRTRAVAAAERCTVDALSPAMTSGIPYVDGGILMRTVSITLTNVSGAECTVAGRPAATLVGTPTGVFTERFTPSPAGTAENVTLGAGDKAETVLRVRDQPATGAAWQPRTLELALPGSPDFYRLAWPAGLAVAQDATSTAGALQPTVAW